MNLKIGAQVFVTDEKLSGKIQSFTAEMLTFLCDDGFEYTFPLSRVYILNDKGEVESKPEVVQFENREKVAQKSENKIPLIFNVKNPVFDLHAEQLGLNTQEYSDYEILALQMELVREILIQANRKRSRKIVFIHGVGKGKLRKTIREYLKENYPAIEYNDGNYQKYGGGATELIIHQFD